MKKSEDTKGGATCLVYQPCLTPCLIYDPCLTPCFTSCFISKPCLIIWDR